MTLAQKHRYEVSAFNILIISTVISTFINYYYKKSFWDTQTKHTTHIALLIVLPLLIWQFNGIRKGKRWAKLSYVILTPIGWVFLVLDYKRLIPKAFTPMPVAINTAIQYLFSVVVVILLIMSLRKPTPEPTLTESE
jgi:hypothetical protein